MLVRSVPILEGSHLMQRLRIRLSHPSLPLHQRPLLRSSLRLRTLRLDDEPHFDKADAVEAARSVVSLSKEVEAQLASLVESLPATVPSKESHSSDAVVVHKTLDWKPKEDVLVKSSRRKTRRPRGVAVVPNFNENSQELISPFTRNKSYRLLTAEEEKTLGVLIQRRVEIEQIQTDFQDVHDRSPTWSELSKILDVDEIQLKQDYEVGGEAKQTMIARNMRLVISMAGRLKRRGCNLTDTVTDGAAGLMRAVEKFDPEKGFKLSTYAHWWIRQSIVRARSESSRVVRVPANVTEEFQRMLRVRAEYEKKHGVKPTDEELTQRLGVSRRRLKAVKNAFRSVTSLDANVYSDDDVTHKSDVIQDTRVLSPETAYAKASMKQDLELVMSTLPEKEATILRLRYGLDDGHIRTLAEISHRFHVTRERVRQIEAKALRKLRARSGTLKEYLDPVVDYYTHNASAAGRKQS